MDLLWLAVLIGVPLFWLCVMAGYAYVDAPKHDMSPTKWAAISFFVPLFGFFAYIFERDERNRDPNEREMFTEGPFEIHESRADDVGVDPGGEPGADKSGSNGRE